jgi:hypothetical protein
MRKNGAPKAMSLRPGLLWLTLNLALIILRLSRNISFQSYTLHKKPTRNNLGRMREQLL